MSKVEMDIKKECFGKIQEVDVFLFTLTNKHGVEIKIMTYGGIVTALSVPDREGKIEDIVLGFDDLKSYLEGHPYFGAIIGRYANRIARGKFELYGTEYKLATNNGENHLHGGEKGFDKVLWKAEEFRDDEEVGLRLSYLSKDMEEGYPGNLTVIVTYSLTNENEFKIDYKAETDKPTYINLTHHSYFNLTACKENILGHEMMINANKYTVVDETLIPTGELRAVKGTALDFTKSKTIGSRIREVTGGYDHNYILNRNGKGLTLAARVYEPKSGRIMEVYTTEPGIQFYSGNFLNGSLTGKNGKVYHKRFGFCLETQHFPDSPNQPLFPSTLLQPGETYMHSAIYKFSVN